MTSTRFANVGLTFLYLLTFAFPFVVVRSSDVAITDVIGLQTLTGSHPLPASYGAAGNSLYLAPQPLIPLSAVCVLLSVFAAAQEPSSHKQLRSTLIGAAAGAIALGIYLLQLPKAAGTFILTAAPGLWCAVLILSAQAAFALLSLSQTVTLPYESAGETTSPQ